MNNSLLIHTAVPSLLATMDALTLEPDFQIFFKKAAAAVRALLGADGTALILLDDDNQTFEYKLFEGEQQHLLNGFKGLRFSATTGISGRVLTSKTSIFTRDYPNAPDAMEQLIDAGLQSNLVIPLISSDKVLGVLASSWFAHTNSVADISPQLLTLAERIASQIAVACHREKLEAQLRALATIDPLTKLLNRRGILQCVDDSLEKLHRYNRPFALFFIDVDGLKSANDHWGHETGDVLLRDVAQRLSDVVRKGDQLGRLGGDEFLIIAECDASHIDILANRFLQALRIPYGTGRKRGRLSGSIGVVLAPQDGVDEINLLRKADAAMYVAKSQGGDRFQRASVKSELPQETQISIVDVEGALERNELQLWYQPICQLNDLSLVGFEALLRWCKPDGEIISAGPLIQTFESARGDLEFRLGNWVLREAARQMQLWSKNSLAPDIHINISPRHFLHPSFLAELQTLCEQQQGFGAALIIEITETAMLEDLERAKRIMLRCRDLGARMAVDDFGTGYASLTYIKRLPLDMIKIDRSFVAELPVNKVDWDITQGIVSIAHALGLAVVAEGAEAFEQIGSLRELGCDQVQGYFIHRPMPFDDANAWLQHKSLRATTDQYNAKKVSKTTKAIANQEKGNALSRLTTAFSVPQEFVDPRFSVAQRSKNRSA
ncbi:putative bifunctional diguanylate cyclase/phosphodiesterase [Cellvibrio sp. OA-2007]|uniref:putative bifunctional diguanylate cyclase/phosphodiesterase n=1 Tax=Cellvibrio sp. OA-2007 TaxID=529823 RepID=UPI0007860F06|nr:bifunctional diguanylate cyclase/phosphodiesterase [Cellvibrio sp. OA-2007]